MAAKAPASPPVDLKKALSSANFATKIQALHDMGADSLMYLKLNDFLGRTNRLLGLETDDLGLGYAATAKNAVERINQPVISSVYHGIAQEQVGSFMGSLIALPAVRKDKDYTHATAALMRASETQARVKDEYPGFQETWDTFFDTELRPVFKGLPNLIHDDEERKQLFQALAAIADGTIPMGMEDYKSELEYAHEAFRDGRTEDLADGIFGLTQKLTHVPPPQPPGPGNGDEDDDDEENDTGGGGRGGSKGTSGNGGGGSQDTEEEDEEDDPNEGDDENEDEDEGGEDPDESEEEEEEKDPFEDLGSYLQQMDEKQEPKTVGAESQFDPKETPHDINVDEMQMLQGIKADIGIPKVSKDLSFLYLETPTPPHGVEAYQKQMAAYASEEIQVRRIIDEMFRTTTIILRGERSGRIDNSRLYRVAFDDPGVFRRDEIDSVGHMDLIVLIDESGSMSAVDKTTGFKNVPNQGHTTSSDQELVLGEGYARLGNDRASTARILAGLLVEASRHLPGFHVEVAGYASHIHLPKLGKLADQAMGALVRQIATTERPYGLVTTNSMGGNADSQAFAYAVEKLAKSDKPQKGLIYLADGHTYDSGNTFDKLIKKAAVSGIAMHFMDLSGSTHYSSGPLAKLPRTQVTSPKEMLTGLKQFLHRVVRLAS